jgi:molybdopterin converting factor small subunit
MKLRVQFTGQLRTAFGRSELDVELPDQANLAQLLERLAAECDRTVRAHLVTDAGRPRPSLLIAINGAAVAAAAASSTILHSGDEVTLLPPVAGG